MSRWCGRPVVHAAAAVLLAVVLLVGGLCLLDCDGGALHDHHVMPQTLCWVVLVLVSAAPALSRLAVRRLPVSEVTPRLGAVSLSVLDPPPRPALV